jgi:hypothetical protein
VYQPCHVCGEPTSEHSNAICNWCGAPFHLALRTDVPSKDCGQVWIDEQFLALEFACNTCLSKEQHGSTADVVVNPAPATDLKRRYTRREGVSAGELVRGRRGKTGRPGERGKQPREETR